MHPDIEILDDLKERVLQVVSPIKIILFGSAVRGDMKPDSDIDILVVLQDDVDCGQVLRKIYRNMIGLKAAVDVIAINESNLNLYGNEYGMVYYSAQKEGREIYAA
ncbi:MAG: nucleotidyltransferase domain-containing protein [Armatimonadetes bacterium]|nr:nucleotidyltransferase domain-containing protein [Armatimonadota bacterium]